MVQGSATVTVADVLFGLEGEFLVLDADHPETGRLRAQGACPGCGAVSSRVKERPLAG